MDPVSQGVLGAAAAQTFSKKPHLRTAAVVGWLGGMAADLDILLRSNTDPLFSLEMHRHFTHSLAFIPVGGLIVATGLWFLFYRKKHHFKTIYLFATLGYATHGLLDSCTSYGTRLLWPFSDFRVTWDNIAIVDPLFTIPILIMASISMRKRNITLARIALIYGISYLSLGAWQNHKVGEVIHQLAQERGHVIAKQKLNPTIGNVIVWRSVYQTGDQYVMDAVRMPIFGEPKLYKGIAIPAYSMPETIPAESILAQDIARFSYFSEGYLYQTSDSTLVDARYSMIPHGMEPLWGISFNPNEPNKHVQQAHLRAGNERKLNVLWEMLQDRYNQE